jgi:hypothetical protein
MSRRHVGHAAVPRYRPRRTRSPEKPDNSNAAQGTQFAERVPRWRRHLAKISGGRFWAAGHAELPRSVPIVHTATSTLDFYRSHSRPGSAGRRGRIPRRVHTICGPNVSTGT